MFYLFLFLHILASIFLILTVLLQSGKAGDLSSAFGGTSSQTAFGARGATTFLSKATTTAAVIFMITCLGLSIMYSSGERSILESVPEATQSPTATPTPAGGAQGATGPAATTPDAGGAQPTGQTAPPPPDGGGAGGSTGSEGGQ